MKERWYAVSGVWTRVSDGKQITALKQKVYDNVSSPEEVLGKFTNECVNGTIGKLTDYSLMLWNTVTFLVPKEIMTEDSDENSDSPF